ncbi:UPF0573 protein C2orf70 homolog A-like [Argonauta hians]
MSKAAGTLITTTQADYISPHFMPRYGGHCPTIKFHCGHTYSNLTEQYLQDFRSARLTSSKMNYILGRNFPSYNTFNPNLLINKRFRCWADCLVSPRYTMLNSNLTTRKNMEKFYQSAQVHRKQYLDKTGTIRPVRYFQVPTPVQDTYATSPFIHRRPAYMDMYVQEKPPNLPELAVGYKKYLY